MASWREKLFLLRGLVGGGKAFTGPFFTDVDLTRRCNIYCRGCRYHAGGSDAFFSPCGPSDIDFELVRRFSQELPRPTCQEVLLTGEGEPMLHPRFWEIVACFKQRGFRVGLVSNGTLLDKAAARRLLASGLDWLRISLWANTPQEYQQAHPGTDPGLFEQVLANISGLRRLREQNGGQRPRIVVHQPITSQNYRNLAQRFELASRLGADALNFAPYHPYGRCADQALAPGQVSWVCAEARRLERLWQGRGPEHNLAYLRLRYRVSAWPKGRLACYIGWLHLRLKYDGTLIPCNSCYRKLGNLQHDSLAQAWNSAAMQGFRRKSADPVSLAKMADECFCNYCCYLGSNLRVNRYARPLRPLAKRRAEAESAKRMLVHGG